MKIEYCYCNLDPDKKSCKPGSRPECRYLTSGILCPYFMNRKEKRDANTT